MSALPGGSADKLGNEYEAWWTLLRVGDVLAGRASRIRVEPPGPAGKGVEFWADEGGRRWFAQAEDAPSAVTWTANRLILEGVVPSVAGHLAPGHEVREVLSTDAPALKTLSGHAAGSLSLAEFKGMLSGEDLGELQKLAAVWDVDEQTARAYLQRVHVEHLPREALRRLVHLRYELLVQGDPEAVVNTLTGWLISQLQKELTAPKIWQYLSAAGFRKRMLAGDSGTLA